jgi:transcription antitermination factor NusG
MSNCGKCDVNSETALLQWFALAVKPRFDKAVAKTLEAKGFPTFLPLYTKQHKYATRSKEFELPLFPGYIFCRFCAPNRLSILTTPGVTQILGFGNQPNPVDEMEIFSLQTAIRAHLRMEPFPFLQVGQKVRVHEGALAGIEGIVVSFKQCLRLVVSISLLQRSVLLEIDRDQVEVFLCTKRSLAEVAQ